MRHNNSDITIGYSNHDSVKKTTLILFSYAIIFFLLYSCVGPGMPERPLPDEEPVIPSAAPGEPPLVRVLVGRASSRVRIIAQGGVSVGKGPAMVPLRSFREGGTFIFRSGAGVVAGYAGNKYLMEDEVLAIHPHGGGRVFLNGRPYRGGFILRLSGKGVIAINVLEVDDYIKGVLPAEIGYLDDSQYQAYRTQAIAARTYALSKLKEKKNRLFDLRATVMDQVYRGVKGEMPTASEAVEDTRGLVCLWKGKPARAYYCACCGGHTADIRVGWSWKESYPYLYGVRDTAGNNNPGSLCRYSSHFRWRESWTGRELERMFRETLPAELGVERSRVGRLRDIRIGGYARSGRVRKLMIYTDRGDFRVEGDRIRWVLMRDVGSGAILRSTLFKMKVFRKDGVVREVRIRGGGNGHGVGMCQAGVIRMAELGYAAEEILTHYYPGVNIDYYYR